MRYLLGIDNGGTYAKAALVDELGKQSACASEQVPAMHVQPGYAERSMQQLWKANCRSVRTVLSKSGVNPENITGVSFSGHGKGLYLVGRNGEPVGNGILSTDNRAWEIVKQWQDNGTAEKVKKKTFQKVLPCQPVSLLAWLKRYEPDLYRQAGYVFSVNDYIRFCMTGVPNEEITAASGSNLINMETGRYDRGIFTLFGIEDAFEKLPPLVFPTQVCGRVTENAAAETGLKPGTPVAAGMFDIDACGIASGLSDEAKMCIIAGTWSINEFISHTPCLDRWGSQNSIFCIPGYYLIEQSSPTSAGNLEWFIQNFLQNCRTGEKSSKLYNQIDAWVDSVAPQESIPVFLPFLNGSNESPFAESSFVGITAYHTRCHLSRAVYEGVVFSHATHVRRLLKNRPAPQRISLTGGVTNSDVWVQMFADVLQLPIDVIDANESGVQGAAIAAGAAVGLYLNFEEAVRNMVHVRKTVQPRLALKEVYEKKFAGYRMVIDALSPVWKYLR